MFIIQDGYIIGSTKTIHGDLVIPEYYHGTHIVGIGKSAFYKMDEITSVQLPPSIKTIGDYAFCKCKRLSKIEFHENMYLGEFAFAETNLQEVVLKEKTQIEMGCFSKCENLREVALNGEIDIPDRCFMECRNLEILNAPLSIFSIGKYAFAECKIGIFISPKTQYIGSTAFYMCRELRTAYFPNAKQIGVGAFAGCVRLKVLIGDKLKKCERAFGSVLHVECYSPALNPHGCFSLNKDCVFKDGFVLSKNKETLIGYYGNDTLVQIPEGVKYIGFSAFAYASKIEKVCFPESLVSIGDFAFYKCENLESVSIKKGLKHISPGAFDESGLKIVINQRPNQIFY